MLISKADQRRLLSASTKTLDRKAVAKTLRAAADKLEAEASLACARIRAGRAELRDDYDDFEDIEEDMDLLLDEEELEEQEHT